MNIVLIKHHGNDNFSGQTDCENMDTKHKKCTEAQWKESFLPHQLGILNSNDVQFAELEYAPEELRASAALGQRVGDHLVPLTPHDLEVLCLDVRGPAEGADADHGPLVL